MPDVGDRVRIASAKVDQAPRDGVVTSVTGQLLRIRWSSGEESTFVPGPGSLTIVGQFKAPSATEAPAPVKADKAKKAPAPAKAARSPKSAKVVKNTAKKSSR